jgi:hypothetical protein
MTLDSCGKLHSTGWSLTRPRLLAHTPSTVTRTRYPRTMAAFPRIHSPYYYGVLRTDQERQQVEVQK